MASNVSDLTEQCCWFTGPSFLKKTAENWPADILQASSQPAVSDKPINAVSCHAQLTQPIDFQTNFTKFSSWFRIVRFIPLFTAPFIFFVIPSRALNIIPHYRRTSELPNSQTQRPNFYSFHKLKVFSRNFLSSGTNNHYEATAASNY